MGRLRAASRPLIVCFLVLGAGLGLSACGGGSELLPGKTAEQINRNLDQVRSSVAEGDCVGAEDAAAVVSEEVDELGGVDKKLKAALRESADRLGEVVSSCGEEALEEAEVEREAEERAEQEEQTAVEAEEEEFEAEQETKQEKKLEHEEEKEEQKSEGEEDTQPPESPGQSEGEEKGKGPPAETPSGNEPPAGGVGPGTEVE